MVASVWPRRRSSSLSGKVGFSSTSAYRSSDSPRRSDSAFMLRIGAIQRRAHAERGAQRLGAIRDLGRAAGLRALLQHQHGEARGARFGLRVRGEAGVGDQREVDHRRVCAARPPPPAVHSPSLARCGAGSLSAGGVAERRQLAAIRARGRGLVRRHRLDVQHEHAVRQPALRGALHVGRRGRRHPVETRLVEIRRAAEHLALGEDVRLAAEAIDALDAAHEVRVVRWCGRARARSRRRALAPGTSPVPRPAPFRPRPDRRRASP